MAGFGSEKENNDWSPSAADSRTLAASLSIAFRSVEAEKLSRSLWMTRTAVSLVLVTVQVLRWFAAFLLDIALIVTILILDDSIQLLVKTWMMVKPKLMTNLHIYI